MTTEVTTKDKLHGLWATLRSTFDEGDASIKSNFQKMKQAIDSGDITLEQVMKQLFGVCATGDGNNILKTEPTSPCQHYREQRGEGASPKAPPSPGSNDEFYYAQFLVDERRRAQHAVASLQHDTLKRQTYSPPAQDELKKQIPRPFPVSSPPRAETKATPRGLTEETLPMAHPAGTKGMITANTSFDDDISAISAHTLEEMARQEEIRRHRALGPVRSDLTSELEGTTVVNNPSMDSTLFPPTPRRSPSNKKTMSSPLSLSRGKSYASKKSHGTKSTQSTNTNTFESVWRRDEQKYWETVVEEDEQRSMPGKHDRKGGRRQPEQPRIQPDTTFVTSSSASWSSHRHPHDTIHYESSDFCVDSEEEEDIPMTTKVIHVGEARFDPDRLQEVLVLDHETELGEI